MKAIIDTNVIIDYLQGREPFFAGSGQVIMAAANMRFDAVVTAKAITDIYYIMHRSFHDAGQTRSAVRALIQLFSIADTTAEDTIRALDSGLSDYENAVMVETAVRIGADCIVTRNAKDYTKAVLPVYSPKEFMLILE